MKMHGFYGYPLYGSEDGGDLQNQSYLGASFPRSLNLVPNVSLDTCFYLLVSYVNCLICILININEHLKMRLKSKKKKNTIHESAKKPLPNYHC